MFVSRLGRKFNVGDLVVHEDVYLNKMWVTASHEINGDLTKPYRINSIYERGVILINNTHATNPAHRPIIYVDLYHKLLHLDDAELLKEIKEVFNAD